LPLRLRGQVIGAINLYCAHEARLGEVELNVAQSLADVATIGLLQERTIRDSSVLTGQLQYALNSRIVIEQAKGVISERHGTSPAEAFTALRSYSRKNGVSLAGLAADVLDGSMDTAAIWT
jgi:hypothetical protein